MLLNLTLVILLFGLPLAAEYGLQRQIEREKEIAAVHCGHGFDAYCEDMGE